VIVAATITTVMLILGTVAIGWYLRRFGGASLGGAFGAVLLALTWVYYEAQILLAGVQLTKVLANRGPRSAPEPSDTDTASPT
jgi:membrane protein